MNLALIGLMFLVLALALFGGKIYSHLQSGINMTDLFT